VAVPSYGRRRQSDIYLAGTRGRKPRVPQDPVALERAARRKMSRVGFAYIAGGAGLETTMAANRAAFERVRIVPRMLRNTSARTLEIELYGRTLPAPILIAPVGALGLAHRDADVAVARAAAAERVPMIFSNQASRSMEECVALMGDAPRWFQLYPSNSDELVRSFLARAERCGCEAVVVTLDTTSLGWRIRDLDLGFLPFLGAEGIAQYVSDPAFQRLVDVAPPPARGRMTPAALRALWRLSRRYPGSTWENLRSPRPRLAVRTFLDVFARPTMQWQDLALVRDATRLPILLKGILHPEDARLALEHGVDGIVVSNHGGRQIDGGLASLEALPPILEVVDGRVPVLVDSGIRGGADVFKAVALGATAVLVGRPYCFGLGIAGEAGVREVLQNFIADFDITLGLAGCKSVAEIGADRLVPV
jgi:isopentenyl diphosphate isomerase/L-lactate dehydrogenase-like FMN-dependent dehydrogenase